MPGTIQQRRLKAILEELGVDTRANRVRTTRRYFMDGWRRFAEFGPARAHLHDPTPELVAALRERGCNVWYSAEHARCAGLGHTFAIVES